MVLHMCACVYHVYHLWYAINVATFKADRFASLYILCNKQYKIGKRDVKCFMLVC